MPIISTDNKVAETLNQIILLGQALLLAVGYPGIFFVVFIENFVGPLPMPPILPLSGMLAAQGKMSFVGVWITAVAGALFGALALYGVGAWVDERVIRTMIRRYGHRVRLSEAQLDQALALFQRYGGGAILIGRTIPILRNMVSLTAGMSHMPVPRFLFYTALISTPSIGVWVYGGYALGENWRSVLNLFSRFEPLIIIVIVIVIIVIAIRAASRWIKQRSQPENALQ